MPWTMVAAALLATAILAWRPTPGARLRDPGRERPRSARDGPSRERVLASLATGGAALILVAGLGWWAVGPAAAVGVASYLVLGRLLDPAATRRRERIADDLPQACDLLAVCLESGLPLRTAAGAVAEAMGGPLGERLGEVVAKVRLGADEAVAWTELGAVEPSLAALGREVGRSVTSGVGLARTLRALGVDARQEAAAAAQVRARKVGVQSVLPLMVCFLPAFLLLGVVPIIGGVMLPLLP
ncbi:MAG: type II secretion system F family protein [Propionicimonas sp.]|uniref:type II secretion system F family protein n=1 Tax=Propionicimonas sp. TaxID=1955623 RepID=UPI003D0FDD68